MTDLRQAVYEALDAALAGAGALPRAAGMQQHCP